MILKIAFTTLHHSCHRATCPAPYSQRPAGECVTVFAVMSLPLLSRQLELTVRLRALRYQGRPTPQQRPGGCDETLTEEVENLDVGGRTRRFEKAGRIAVGRYLKARNKLTDRYSFFARWVSG